MLFIIITALALGISLFIETSSWWIRANASVGNFGHYISRSNIYLYSARLFSLGFSILLAIQIESNYSTFDITISLAISFLFASGLQFFLLALPQIRVSVMKFIMKIMFLQEEDGFSDQAGSLKARLDKNLFFSAFLSSIIFAGGVSIPSFLSSIFIENRLVISNLGQFINAFGAIIVLFVVDQKLFRALDEGRLSIALLSYTYARVASSLFMSAIFFIICVVL